MSAALEVAREQAGLSVVELWVAYIALGGLGTPAELEAMLAGRAGIAGHDNAVLAQTLSERFADIGLAQEVLVPAGPGT